MEQVVVVELLIEGEEALDLGDLLEQLGKTKLFSLKSPDDGWVCTETGDKIDWFDGFEDDDCDDEEHDHGHPENATLIGAISIGKNRTRTSALLVQWFLDNVSALNIEPDQFNLTVYYAEVE